MRYIPNLVPQELKVLPDYCKESGNSNQPNNIYTKIVTQPTLQSMSYF